MGTKSSRTTHLTVDWELCECSSETELELSIVVEIMVCWLELDWDGVIALYRIFAGSGGGGDGGTIVGASDWMIGASFLFWFMKIELLDELVSDMVVIFLLSLLITLFWLSTFSSDLVIVLEAE